MLNEEQYLLICLMEECDEISQRVAKALRFGLDEVQPGQTLSNRERITGEINDFLTVMDLLERRGSLPLSQPTPEKVAKIDKFMDYSADQGVLVRS